METNDGQVRITHFLSIPEKELIFTASRSGGPGGQNVNKVSSRITLWFDVLNSPSLREEDKQRILQKLPTRINKAGWLWVSAQQSRSQADNRESARRRLVELLQQALIKPPSRKKTRVPRSVREQRIVEKKRHGQLKAKRSPRILWDS
jgi:ribosome-associated protein